MEKLMKCVIGFFIIGIVTTISLSSCDRQDEPYLVGKHRSSEEVYKEESGISLDMENDEMDEDMEEIHIGAEEWGEEGIDANL